MKKPVGRPPEYDFEKLHTLIEEYLLECQDIEEDKENGIKQKVNIPSIEGLALKLDINKTTIYEWEKINKDFSNDIDKVRAEQAKRLLNKGLSGDYNPTIAKVLLTKHGYREGIDQTSNDKDVSSIVVEVIKTNATQTENNDNLGEN